MRELVLVIICLLLPLSWGSSREDALYGENSAVKRSLSALGQHYDKRIRPGNETTIIHNDVSSSSETSSDVRVNMYIRSLYDIDTENMDFGMQITLREEWNDERLKHEGPYLTLTDVSEIWQPDLFFSNEKDAHLHELMVPNIFARIYPDGQVLLSSRISLTFFCPMDLKKYPMDTQVCTVRMGSYGYNTDHIIFQWKEDNPVVLATNIFLEEFILEKHTTETFTSTTSTGSYSSLKLDLVLRRDLSQYVRHLFLPSALLVVASWVTLWLPPEASSMRVTLGFAALLLTGHITSGLPKTTYTIAGEVWGDTCMGFIVCLLLEYALLLFLQRRRGEVKGEKRDAAVEDGDANVPTKKVGGEDKQKSQLGQLLDGASARVERLDAIARVTFPSAFAIFNLIYWLAYLS